MSSRTSVRSRGPLLLALFAGAAIPSAILAGAVTIPHTFANGTVASADQVNANFAALALQVNDNDTRLDAFTIAGANVGIGGSPAAKLDVQGPVRLGSGGATFAKLFFEDFSVDPPSIAAGGQYQYGISTQCPIVTLKLPRSENNGNVLWGDTPEKANGTIWYHYWGGAAGQEHNGRWWVINNAASAYDPPARTVRVWELCE